MSVQITIENEKIFVASPYLPGLPNRAKRIGGKWNAPNWVFDIRDEQRVRELYIELYGTDGSVPGELVTVRVTVNSEWIGDRESLFLYGRQIARAFGRDSGAKIGDGVSIVSENGNFRSGGSMKNWVTVAPAGLVFEIRDVPRAAFENNGIPYGLVAEIVENKINRTALENEKIKLMARIAEIDQLLEAK